MRLTDLRFLFFFISVLGEVVAIGKDGPVLAVLGAELSPFEREEVTRPLGDWRSREGLMKGEYASDVILLVWLPGRTKCTVAIDLGEGPGIQND